MWQAVRTHDAALLQSAAQGGSPQGVDEERGMTKAEAETTIRWDQEERLAWLGTTHPPMMRRWVRLGYPLRVIGTTRDGQPRSWAATVPVKAVTFRRLAFVAHHAGTPTSVPIPTQNSHAQPGPEARIHPPAPLPPSEAA
jgi:hypothetical protein